MDDDRKAKDKASEGIRIAGELGRLLKGRGSEVQAAALAEAMAMWLAGHFVLLDDNKTIDRKATDDMRELLFTAHIDVIRKLIEVNEEMIIERTKAIKKPREAPGAS